MSNRFTQYILIAMALGIVMGALIFNFLPDQRVELAADINLIAMLFLRLIKMIIAPLVFATLVGGISHMGSGAKLGRVFAKTMGWFVSASFVSLLLGLVMVNLMQPGANFPGTLPDKGQSTGLPVSAFSIEKFLTHLIPTSIADAMAQNEILQIVVFAVFFAVVLGAAPERAKPIMGERAKQVAFSPLMFVAGIKLMVPKASGVSAVTDLKGKTVIVTKGTTNEQAMHNADKKLSLGLNIVASPDHEQSYQMLVDGKADAFATDDILLYGLIARHKSQDKFRVTGDYLSYDPYGIMFRKGEPQLTPAVERTFRKLGSNHDLIPLYNKWFVSRLPTGERLNVGISPQLEDAFKAMDDSPSGNN
jgi:hypothetical protein